MAYLWAPVALPAGRRLLTGGTAEGFPMGRLWLIHGQVLVSSRCRAQLAWLPYVCGGPIRKPCQ